MHVLLYPIDQTNIKIDTDESVLMELNDRYSFFVHGHMFSPLYKNHIWDGKKRLISLKYKTIQRGLLEDLVAYCESQGYTTSFSDAESPQSAPQSLTIESFLEGLTLPHIPHDFQVEALKNIVFSNGRKIIESATGSGKSLIQYLIVMYALQSNWCEKILIVVPTTMLVDQLTDDFCEYGENDPNWNRNFVHKIYAGEDKQSDAPITISTWQSLYALDEPYFHQYDGILVDEVHEGKSDSITKIVSSCINAHLRVGATGTLDDVKLHRLILQGLFGSVIKVSSAAELMERKILAQLTVKCITLKYQDEDECKLVRKMSYDQELDYIVELEKRNLFVSKLASNLKGNKLILVTKIEHGNRLIEALSGYEGPVHFINGKMKPEKRSEIRKACELSDNMVIIATYKTFQLGVNIVNLDHVIFASPSKSKTRVLQSIGRTVRRSAEKVEASAYDIVDDFTGIRKRQNYLLKHFLERFKYYCEENFNVVQHEIKF